MRGFPKKFSHVYIKREDESGFGISGSKKRKYASLLPFLLQHKIEVVGLIGGGRSNHIAGLLQLLREHQLAVRLFLKASHDQQLSGNRLLLHLLSDPSEIIWIEQEDWKQVEKIMPKYLPGEKSFLIPEGGTCSPSLPGACTLMLDILRNEREGQLQFDHIFLDSGTALMAGALTMVHHWISHPAQLHVVMMADGPDYFEDQLHLFQKWSQEQVLHSSTFPTLPHIYSPISAKSFGSVNATILAEVKRMALEEGVLTDPIYTAKLFLTARSVIEKQQLHGNILIIHSGGGVGLMGFGEKLK